MPVALGLGLVGFAASLWWWWRGSREAVEAVLGLREEVYQRVWDCGIEGSYVFGRGYCEREDRLTSRGIRSGRTENMVPGVLQQVGLPSLLC